MSSALKADLEEKLQAFATKQITPLAGNWSMGESPSNALFLDAAKLGIFGLEVPKEQGGAGHLFGAKVQCCEILASADFGFAMSLINTHNVAVRLAKSGSPELTARYLPHLLSGEVSACTALTEPSTGTDVASITSRAIKTNEGWVLSGEKTWIVNARHAGLSVVFAQCGIGAFLVDLTAKGVTRYPINTTFSQTSMGTGGFVMEDVVLDDDNLLLAPGSAFKEILNEINGARIYVAAMCMSMLKTALAEVAAYGDIRMSFGKPLSAHFAWKKILDAAEASLNALKTIVVDATARFEAGLDAQLIAAQSKIEAVEACLEHLPQLLHAMGAEGLKANYCFSRHLAATQIAGLTDGATSMLRARVEKLTAS